MKFPRATHLIITANTKEIAEELKDTVSQFLKNRGLTLSEEKTMITYIDDGFDFLDWTFRKFKGKLIVKPLKNSIKTLIRKCATIILKEGKAYSQGYMFLLHLVENVLHVELRNYFFLFHGWVEQ